MARNALSYLNIQRVEATEVFHRLEEKLNENSWYKQFLDYSEECVKVNRVYIAVGCCLFITTLLYNFGIHLICGAIGFLYPGYKTIECLEKNNMQQEGKKWLTYWLIFSAFNFSEIFFFFLRWFPGYWIVKCVFFLYCIQGNGSDVIYNSVIRPFFQRYHEAIDEANDALIRSASAIVSNAEINFDNNVQREVHSHAE